MTGEAWQPCWRDLSTGTGRELTLRRGAAPVTFQAFLTDLETSSDRSAAFAAMLASLPYAAIRFECPVLTMPALARPFHCVALDAPDLAGRHANCSPFQKHFAAAPPGAVVTSFLNLGRDAILVAPLRLAPTDSYPQLSTFLHSAPKTQIAAFLALMARETLRLVAARPVWLNTAGGGVDWLHGRLDSRPKYYQYLPYKKAVLF
ncbi:MAG TPA: hypothetical protein VMB71_15185 [Acetobacteraceae bacterium]|nr:hypothetical protein [Acetobacteraceae bacterium]